MNGDIKNTDYDFMVREGMIIFPFTRLQYIRDDRAQFVFR